MNTSILILTGLGLTMGPQNLSDPVINGPLEGSTILNAASDGALAKKTTVAVDLDYDSVIVNLQVGEEGIPCNVEVTGTILDLEGSPAGTFLAGFFKCPVFAPLPESLGDNIYGIPPGTEMPAWDGTVVYMVNGRGIMMAKERAFIFPTDPADPESPLAVLSVSTISSGTDSLKGAKGEILTPDGYDGLGSLIGTLTLK